MQDNRLFNMKVLNFSFCLFMAAWKVASSQTLLPSSDVNLMNYYLYTSSVSNVSIEYNNPASLAASGFNPNQPTTLLIDGFLSNATSSQMTKTLKNALLSVNYPGNIIIVDWGALSGGTSGLLYDQITTNIALTLYPIVVINAKAIGARLGQFIDFLGVPGNSFQIYGHSEGAHIAGIAGNYYHEHGNEYIQTIVGLDPAGPLYLYLDVDLANNSTLSFTGQDQLDPSDGAWVVAYHTGRGPSIVGLSLGTGPGFGTTGSNVGDVDVFVNYGDGQPGCSNPTNFLAQSFCNHQYSWKFYASTILSDTTEGCDCDRTSIANLFASCVCGTNPLCLAQPNCGIPNPVNVGYGLTWGSTGGLWVKSTATY